RPERIEVYDNSHIQGTNALGAMIVAGPEGFIKNQYRKFNMKTAEFNGDDFAMMKAMIRRGFARMLAEREDDDINRRPSAGEVVSEANGRGELDNTPPSVSRDALDSSPAGGGASEGGGGKIADGGVDFSKERDFEASDTKFAA